MLHTFVVVVNRYHTCILQYYYNDSNTVFSHNEDCFRTLANIIDMTFYKIQILTNNYCPIMPLYYYPYDSMHLCRMPCFVSLLILLLLL